MTLEQIQASNINLDMAREALTQADKRLADTLANKDALERKAAALFGGYVTGALALTGVGATMFKEDGLDNPMSLVFLMAGGFLLAGLIVLAFVFYDRQYGALGSDPEIWLRPGTIDVQNVQARCRICSRTKPITIWRSLRQARKQTAERSTCCSGLFSLASPRP